MEVPMSEGTVKLFAREVIVAPLSEEAGVEAKR